MKKAMMAATAFVFLLSGCSVIEKNDAEVSGDNNHIDTDTKSNTITNKGTSGSTTEKNETADVKANGTDQAQSTTSKGAVSVVANPTDIDVVVNKSNALPKGYRPSDLVRPNVKFVFGDQKLDKALMRSEAASALEKMFDEAKSQGMDLFAASGFRSYERQDELFKQEVNQVGKEKAVMAVAVPGTSEHQTGLTMDITAPSVKYTLTQNFENVKEGKWLANHAHEFGFILRYPKGKENITQYKYEPWHYRYVGTQIATEMYEKGITLEEYFGKVGV